MSAISNVLKLLLIFEDDQKIFKASELSEEIGVSPRQISNYISELRKFGYVIESSATKGGGYRGIGQSVRLPMNVTYDEITALAQLIEFIKKNDVFVEKEDISRLYYKLISVNKTTVENTCIDYKLLYSHVHKVKEKNHLKIISKAINNYKKLKIVYFSANSQKEDERIIHPYLVQLYQGANYIHGYCENANDYRVFKFIRIKEVSALDQSFIKEAYIEKKLEKKNFGLFNESKLHLVLSFTYPYNEFAKEIILGENSKITIIDSETTQMEVDITNETEIIGWLLSFGDKVKVLEPKEMRKKVWERAEEVVKLYQGNLVGSNGS